MLRFNYDKENDDFIVRVVRQDGGKDINFVYGIITRDGKFHVRFSYEWVILDRQESNQLMIQCQAVLRNPVAADNDIKPAAPKPVLSATNPSHYKFTLDGKEYDIDQVIVALGLPWRLANAMKYIARAGKKDDEVQDISKAITYLQRHIQ